MKTTPIVTRRSFVRSGLAGVLAAAVAPPFLPSRLFGRSAPSHRVALGCVGLGVHGHGVNLLSFLQEEDCVVRAVCDVFADRTERSRAVVNGHYGNRDCAATGDFRELFARSDLDAVVISTPDHWHVPMALMALEAGKAVFCEKPTLTIESGRRLADAVKRGNAFFACGLEDRAEVKYHLLATAVRNGAIGKLRRIRVGLPEKPVFPRVEPSPVPPGLDYDLWLGPAPHRPYTPGLTDAQVWRQIRDFSGGSLTDWGAHLIDTAQVAAGVEESGPVAVTGEGFIPPDAINTVPLRYRLHYRYANGVELGVESGSIFIRLEGDDGWVGCTDWNGRMEASDLSLLRRKYNPQTSALWPRRPREQRDFLDCLRERRPPMYTAEALHRLSTTLHLGAIAMELNRPLRWDPAAEVFPGDETANALRSRPERMDWQRA